MVTTDVERMTLDEKVAFVTGDTMWSTPGVMRLGVGPLRMSDGPNGVRGCHLWVGDPGRSACFPCGAALGATWDRALVYDVGAALAREARRKGVHLLLGPSANIPRLPIAGRNFECFSEDPLLSAQLAATLVQGVQAQGVGAVVKHFVANDAERDRMSVSSVVDERSLREIYLPPFESAVREGGAVGVMAACNRINGTFACEDAWLLTTVLRQEWGFRGVVVSDWFATRSTVASALAGLDVEMPGPARWWGPALAAAVREGSVPETVVDDKVRRVMTLSRWSRTDERKDELELSVDDRADRWIARRAASASTVLLKNRRDLLPLDGSSGSTIALIGPASSVLEPQGGGSARVNPHPITGLPEAVQRRGGGKVDVLVEPGCRIDRRLPALEGDDGEPSGDGSACAEYFTSPDWSGPVALVRHLPTMELLELGSPGAGLAPGRYSVRVSARHRARVEGTHRFSLSSSGYARLSIGGTPLLEVAGDGARNLEGGAAHEVTTDVDLSDGASNEVELLFRPGAGELLAAARVGHLAPQPPDLMERAERLAARADVVVVCVGRSPEWESEGFDMESMRLPGRQDELVERVARVNRNVVVVVNAGAAVSMPWAAAVGSILQVWYPGEEGATALADVLFGRCDPGGRLPVTFPYRVEDCRASATYPPSGGELRYDDGVFVGYRHHDAAKVPPAFCFGHGLSYTRFDYGTAAVSRADAGGALRLSVDVTNVGDRAGTEVVQLYVHPHKAGVERPPQELKGFEKLHLQPGYSATVSFVLDSRAFSYWCASRHCWIAEPGDYELLVGSSSRDVRAAVTVGIG